MRVTVQYSAQARDAAGTSQEAVEFSGSNVRDLLAALADKHEPLRRLVLHPSILVFVGDERVDGSRSLQTDETVCVMTPISGG